MPIKLIVCDLDGTLIGKDLDFTPRLSEAVQHAQARNITVTIATGRGFPATRHFANRLGVTAPLICYQGAQIRTLDGKVLHESTLSRTHLPPVIAHCQVGGWELAVYWNDEIYQTTSMYNQDYYDRWFSLPIHRVDDLMTALPGDPCKFIAIAPTKEKADQLERQIRGLAADQFQVMRSHAWFVEGLAAGVSKGDGVARLARQLDIGQEQVMAIGDSGNDASMVEWAGLGVAMGDASPDVKAVAQVVAPLQAENGAAWAIEQYALGKTA
jgi:Cof subfamily protein (haloacid dehalogenase superfamily)